MVVEWSVSKSDQALDVEMIERNSANGWCIMKVMKVKKHYWCWWKREVRNNANF